MNSIVCETSRYDSPGYEAGGYEEAGPMIVAADGIRELVRGNERCFLEQMKPLVRQQSILLDLRTVERIDAAGIATLITLYGEARDRGHNFAVCNASGRVREILELVGLDRVLLSHILVQSSHTGVHFERPAA